MFNKRGNSLFNFKRGMDIDLWFNVFELVIVFLVGLVLLDMVNSEATGSFFEKQYLARDTSLVLSAIYASPGDVEYNYQEKTGNFIFDIKRNKIEIYEKQEFIEGGVVDYPFAEDKTYTLFYKKILPKEGKNIVYKKNKNTIDVTN